MLNANSVMSNSHWLSEKSETSQEMFLMYYVSRNVGDVLTPVVREHRGQRSLTLESHATQGLFRGGKCPEI